MSKYGYIAIIGWFFLIARPDFATRVGPFASEQACQAYQQYLDQAGFQQLGIQIFKCWNDGQGHRE